MKSDKQGMTTKRRRWNQMSFLNHARGVFFCPKAPYRLLKKNGLAAITALDKQKNNTWTADHPSRLPMVQYYSRN
jgi:hypothetical protein